MIRKLKNCVKVGYDIILAMLNFQLLQRKLYTHIHVDVSRNIITTSMNERTNTLLYKKNIPLTLYSQKVCERVDVGYVWEVSWRRRETATHWPQVPLTIAALHSHSAGLLNRGPEGPSPPSGAGYHSGILYPTGTATGTPTDCNSNWTRTDKPSRQWHLII